jgi:hypothetical protein
MPRFALLAAGPNIDEDVTTHLISGVYRQPKITEGCITIIDQCHGFISAKSFGEV